MQTALPPSPPTPPTNFNSLFAIWQAYCSACPKRASRGAGSTPNFGDGPPESGGLASPLQAPDHLRGGGGASVEGTGDPADVVPLVDDQLGVDAMACDLVERAVVRPRVEPEVAAVGKVGKSRREGVEGGAKHDPSSCGARMHVVQASKHSSSGDRSVAGQGPGQWALEREPPMGAVEVVVVPRCADRLRHLDGLRPCAPVIVAAVLRLRSFSAAAFTHISVSCTWPSRCASAVTSRARPTWPGWGRWEAESHC